jgi:hypothetical protein
VRKEFDELGGSGVRFTIRALPYEGPNWYIDTDPPLKKLRRDEQAAVSAASFELRSKYYLVSGRVARRMRQVGESVHAQQASVPSQRGLRA